MVEGMLAGCCVLTTGSGGAAEIAAAADLPVFPAGSATYLEHLLQRTRRDRGWMVTKARTGQRVAKSRFTLERMANEYEAVFRNAIHGTAPLA
jgi:glycosyltransferase involved in cell wall biosynthesis